MESQPSIRKDLSNVLLVFIINTIKVWRQMIQLDKITPLQIP